MTETVVRSLARVLAALLLLVTAGAASSAAASVGYRVATVPAADGLPAVPLAVWYPSDASASDQPLGLFRQEVAPDGAVRGRRLPLVVISHGNGGTKDGHYDTALALAQAGFVVAALEHPGDNYRDQSRAVQMADRPRDLGRVITYMLSAWPEHARVDAGRVGAFGFSSGGFTVLAAAGGEPDLSRMGAHCAAHPRNFDCVLTGSAGVPPEAASATYVHDPRIRAVVAAAPALGFAFEGRLSGVRAPVQLWRADLDRVLPAPDYADAVRAALPRPPEFHGVPGADHWDFLAPCSPALAKEVPRICGEIGAFDRAAFHRTFDAEVVRFFKANLR